MRDKQVCVIEDWHPTWNPNGTNNRSHWAILRRRHSVDATTAWAAAQHAGWELVQGKVRLTITFVYPRKYRVDPDNLTARCKGVIDGLKKKEVPHAWRKGITTRAGFFYDDSTDWLELKVTSEVQRGRKALILELEPLLAAGRSEAAEITSSGSGASQGPRLERGRGLPAEQMTLKGQGQAQE